MLNDPDYKEISLTHYFTYAFMELFFAFVSIGEVKAATSEATLPLKFAMICRPGKNVSGCTRRSRKAVDRGRLCTHPRGRY